MKTSNPDQWNHVDTQNNPADCATRALSPKQLSGFDSWWKGPIWLRPDGSTWSTFNTENLELDAEISETKQTKVQVHAATLSESIISNHSSYQKLIRIVSTILRFTFNTRKINKTNRRFGPLTVAEFLQGLIQLVRLVQHNVFATEIHTIQLNKPLSNKSKVHKWLSTVHRFRQHSTHTWTITTH